ncbi:MULTISPECIES: hypothetical protein [unclassified Ruminococcus]|uniref:hypothetical protein n=1 Tax=unclassified Ruminococcus TaxID=2608920 RepID=UPI00319E9EF5
MQAVRLDWTPRNRITIPLTGTQVYILQESTGTGTGMKIYDIVYLNLTTTNPIDILGYFIVT